MAEPDMTDPMDDYPRREPRFEFVEDPRAGARALSFVLIVVGIVCVSAAIGVTHLLAQKQRAVAALPKPDSSHAALVVERVRTVEGVTIVQVHAQAMGRTCLFARLGNQLAGPVCINDEERPAL